MSTPFITLPPELHLLVFSRLSDLDDALSLSRTSSYFSKLYTSHKSAITKQIILSSDVYEYDFCLSKLLTATSDLAERYRRSGSQLPAEERPEESVFLDCINSQWIQETSPDKIIDDIVLRWQRTRILRELYQDDKTGMEYIQFRVAFTSASTPLEAVSIAEPGFTLPSDPQRRTARYGNTFNSRFHRALCLHSIVIASRRLAMVTLRPAIKLEPDIEEVALDFWDKSSVIVEGKKITPTVQDKLDCLEVFDFLYMFILRKLFPIGNLESWIKGSSDEWLFQEHSRPVLISPDTWFLLLSSCRNSLLPLGLVDLLFSQAWKPDAKYPPDMALYLVVRGTFDAGEISDSDWYTFYERQSMVINLEYDESSELPYEFRDAEASCWWDVQRLICGSPFHPQFRWKSLKKT